MPNEVNITITASDLSGPAFASALARMDALRAAARNLAKDFNNIGAVNIDPGQMTASLNMLKSKMQSLGIADIADVNVSPGRLSVQLNLLKRLIQQAKISDLMDVNLNTSDLQNQLSKIAGITETIPVNFKINKPDIPRFFVAPSQGLPTVIPGSTGHNLQDRISVTGLADATAQLAALTRAADAASGTGGGGGGLLGLGLAAGGAWGWFGRLAGSVPLFGGALAGIPFVGAIGGFHLLAEVAIETAAVLIPAGIALAAFGAGAAPTIADISHSMQSLSTVSTALGQNIYPLTNAFSNMEDAVKPSVMTLFGEALVVAGRDTGMFTSIAVQAGHALDTLGARAAVALTSGGFGTFLSQGPKDLAQIGDIIGNIFGTVGNLLHVMPGYANILLSALDDVTKGLEAVTSNPIGQWVIGAGLAFHGAVVWLGLGATAAVYLGNALVGLGAKLGLVDAGMLAFDAAAFGAGIKQMLGGVGLLAGELVTLGAGEDIAAAGALTMEGAWAALGAINPLVWVGAGVAALAGLVFWLGKSTSATSQYDNAVRSALSSVPVSQAGTLLMSERANTTSLLNQAQMQLNQTQEFAAQVNLHTGMSTTVVSQAYKNQLAVVQGLQGEQATLAQYQSNYNELLRAAGGNLSFVTAAGITTNQMFTDQGQALKQDKIEVQAQKDAFDSLALGAGRAAAAQNALGKSGAASFDFITQQIPAIQKYTQAEDSLLNVLLGSEQTFVTQQQALNQLGTDFSSAGGKVGGLSAASLALSSDFYTSLIPAAQKTIDALNTQGISQSDLTKVVATSAGEMLNWAGHNLAAQAVVEGFINNALGPGTVSLQGLNKWVGNNSTSLQGFNSIVAKSTIAAGSLAGILQNDLNVQFQQSLLKSSGANQAIANMTYAITHGGTSTSAYHGARQQLITDLINTGMTATQAKNYVNGLQTQINNMHGKSVNVDVNASGSGGILVQASGMAARLFKLTHEFAQGGRITQGTHGTADDVLIRASRGETVVSASDSKKLAPAFASLGIPGYAGGGIVGIPGLVAGQASSDIGGWAGSDVSSMLASMVKIYDAQAAAAKAAISASIPLGSGALGQIAGGSNEAILMAVAARHGWTSANGEWPALYNVEMREAGFNTAATNPSSGAYGMAQFINGPSEYAQYGGNSYTALGQSVGMCNYIAQRYGDPKAAWAHEQAFNWYDNGGWLKPGWNPPMYNGTGMPEHLTPDSGGGRSIHITLSFDESFQQATGLTAAQVNAIRHTVRGHGGNVQDAFGRH